MADTYMPKSHDIFFREEFSKRENIIDFIEGTFPEKILNKLNLSTLSNNSGSYTDEELKEYFSDIVYTCKSEDKEVVISLLFEHKSYPVPFPHIQLLKYTSKIWELGIKQTGKPTQVIPVILYHGREPWNKRSMADYFDGYDEVLGNFLPQFDYLLIDLSKFSNDEIKGVVFKKAALKITLLMMKNIFHEEILERSLADYLEIGRLYFEEEKGLKFLESIVRYLYKSTNIEVNKVISATKTISERGGEVTMTTAMRLIEQGKKEGRIEGKIEGEKEGELKGKIEGELKGKIEGQRNGLKIAIELGLELKFGIEGLKLFERVASIESIERLHLIKEAIKISKNLEEISKLLDT